MAVGDTMGNPVEKLVEQIRLGMTGGYPAGDFRSDKIGGMLELG